MEKDKVWLQTGLFVIIHYVVSYKTIHMYYLKKLYNLLNRSCD